MVFFFQAKELSGLEDRPALYGLEPNVNRARERNL